MMRQYELVERVTRYNPNADENLLNKAYVYAMQKHGTQQRANGDPYFSHPLEVAGILTDLKLDDATIAVALLHDTIEDTDATRAEIDAAVRRGDRPAGRGPDQDQQARPRLEEGGAGREPPQAPPRHLRRRPRAPGQARRPPAQHAHPRAHAGGGAQARSPRRRSRSTRRSPAAWACTTCARSSRSSPSARSTRRPTRPSPTASPSCATANQSLIARHRAAS